MYEHHHISIKISDSHVEGKSIWSNFFGMFKSFALVDVLIQSKYQYQQSSPAYIFAISPADKIKPQFLRSNDIARWYFLSVTALYPFYFCRLFWLMNRDFVCLGSSIFNLCSNTVFFSKNPLLPIQCLTLPFKGLSLHNLAYDLFYWVVSESAP